MTHGAQAFWNRQEGAQELAEAIQQTLNGVVNTHRAKQAKAISDSIYLMKQALFPESWWNADFSPTLGKQRSCKRALIKKSWP